MKKTLGLSPRQYVLKEHARINALMFCRRSFLLMHLALFTVTAVSRHVRPLASVATATTFAQPPFCARRSSLPPPSPLLRTPLSRPFGASVSLCGRRGGGGGRGSGRRSQGGGSGGPRSSELPTKECVVCGRPFTWRKKWERCWDEVTTCSKKCNAERRNRSREGREVDLTDGEL